MPFPLAHPAAVLPFRRYCPRYLNLPALVIGSLVPDLGYLGRPFGLDELSHRPVAGTLLFSLPAGVVLLGLFYYFRRQIVKLFPPHLRQRLVPLCQQPAGTLLGILVSLILGIGTHLIWDSFTHKDTWMFENVPLLQIPLARWGYHQLRVSSVLWYISSFGGIACLGWVYVGWLEAGEPVSSKSAHKVRLASVLLVAFLILPVAAVHHLAHIPLGDFLVGALTLAIVVGCAWRMGSYDH